MSEQHAAIPMRFVGPIKIAGPEVTTEVEVPLATFEQPLWPSVNRGARVSRLCGGISAVIVKDVMTRSVLVQAENAESALQVVQQLRLNFLEMQQVVAKTSKFAQLVDWSEQIVGNLLFLRFSFQTADAAGHNMVTQAAEALLTWLLQKYSALHYISLSGNYCVDKKVSAVNGILGRGKYVVAELLIPAAICNKQLRTTPELICELNLKKNLIGTNIAGGLRSANAHFANMLLAIYLATGQDGANIVEGSQGIVHTEMRQDALYFSVTLPNIIVGTVGSGKDIAFVRENLERLGCVQSSANEGAARRLAIIVAATVLCGELSLLAALTNQRELMRCHTNIERKMRKRNNG